MPLTVVAEISLVCTVCARSIDCPGDFKHTTVKNIVNHEDGTAITDWTWLVAACRTCQEKFGDPVQIIAHPLGKSRCIFTKTAGPILLEGSGPMED